MGKLSSAIVQRKLAPLRDVEEALARQVLYGGDLATNLLEQAPTLDERILSELLAETSGLRAAPHGELPRASPETLKLLPGDVALRHGVFPLSFADGALRVAVSEKLREDVEQDIGFGLGVRLEQRIAPLVRIRQAIGRDYRLPLDRRTQRVIAKIEGRPDPNPSIAPGPFTGATDIASLPRPPSIPPLGLPAPMDVSPIYSRPRTATPPPPPATPIVPVIPRNVVGVVVAEAPTAASSAEDISIHERVTAAPPAAVAGASSEVARLVAAEAGTAVRGAEPPADPTPVGNAAAAVTTPLGLPPPEPPPAAADATPLALPKPSSALPTPRRPSEPAPELTWDEPAPGAGAPEAAPEKPAAEAALLEESPPTAPSPEALPAAARRSSRPAAPAPPAAAPAPAAPTPPEVPPPSVVAVPSSRSGQHSIDLGAWGAKSKAAGRRTRTKHRGPYTAADAERDLFAADERDTILTAFFDFGCQYFEYSALFVVHGDLAEGRDAYGPGADRAAVAGIGVQLDLPSSMATVRASGHFSVAPLAKDGLDARLAVDLRRRAASKVLLMPVVVRGRTVVVLYGDDGNDDVELSQIGDVIAFAPLVATALESLILRKKTAVRQAAQEADTRKPPSVRPALSRRASMPSREERAEALSGALQTSLRPIQKDGPRSASSIPPAELPKLTAFVPSASPAPGLKPEQKRPSTKPAIPAARPRSGVPVEPARSPTPSQGTPTAAAGRESQVPIPLSRRSTAAAEAPVSRPTDETQELEAPEISVTESDVDGDLTDDIEDLGPSSIPVVVGARPLVKRHESAELRLPSVILNIDTDVGTLVERLEASDDSVIAKLVQSGAMAASLLVSRLPGPISPGGDRLDSPTKASERGPVLKALLRIGQPAVPFIAVRSNDADPQVRLFATLLLGEIPSSDSAQAVARRVTDANADVRRAALDAGRLLQADDEARTILRDRIASVAEDDGAPVDTRVAALEALAHVRDGRVVPRLIRLASRADEVGRSAQWALGVITRQAFRGDVAAWEAWWTANTERHRLEWLIDALMHEETDIRRAAGEELKALTKEYFGYYDDLAKNERLKAQKRYREWWEATGKARFSA